MISKNKLFIIVVVVIGVFIGIQFFYYFSNYVYKVKEVRVVEMRLQISNYLGFNLTNQSLNFGTVGPGGGAFRDLNLESSEPVKVRVFLKGKLAEWTTVAENDFIFNGTKSLTFTVKTPMNIKVGNYTGEAILIFKVKHP